MDNHPRLIRRDSQQCADRTWGFVADKVEDAPSCIAECRGRFLSDVLLEYETFDRVCAMLQNTDDRDASEGVFRAVYCCDAQLCGVDHLQMAGKDPIVNWLLDSCRNIGFDSIADPGPPNATYICGQGAGYGGEPWCQGGTSTDSETVGILAETSLISDISSATEAATHTATTITSSVLSQTSQTSMSDPTTTSAAIDASDTAVAKASDTSGGTASHSSMSTGVKVAIGVVVAAVSIAFLLLLACLLRRRRKGARKKEVDNDTKQLMSPPPPPRPLSVPASLPTSLPDTITLPLPLTPPPRLRERRLLPTPVASARTTSSGTVREHAEFPLSPVFSPMAGKLSPRHERTLKRKTGSSPLGSPIMLTPSDGRMTPVQPVVRAKPESTLTSNTPVASAKPSPRSPSRLGDQALNITELVSPGPPPTRALPSTPPNGTRSPAGSPPQKAKAVMSPGASIASPSQDSVLSPDPRQKRPISKDQARELRNSW